MRVTALIVYTALVASIVSIAPGWAEQKGQPYFKDGVINFDRQKFKKEFDQHERDANNPGKAARALRKNEFCIVCDDGTRFNCRSLFRGEVGRLACGAKGICCVPRTIPAGSTSAGVLEASQPPQDLRP